MRHRNRRLSVIRHSPSLFVLLLASISCGKAATGTPAPAPTASVSGVADFDIDPPQTALYYGAQKNFVAKANGKEIPVDWSVVEAAAGEWKEGGFVAGTTSGVYHLQATVVSDGKTLQKTATIRIAPRIVRTFVLSQYANEAPVSGAILTAKENGHEIGTWEILASAHADDPRFVQLALPAMEDYPYQIHIEAAGFAPLHFVLPKEVKDTIRSLPPLKMWKENPSKSGVLKGKILGNCCEGKETDGLTGLAVQLKKWDGTVSQITVASAQLDSKGAFEFTGLEAGHYELVTAATSQWSEIHTLLSSDGLPPQTPRMHFFSLPPRGTSWRKPNVQLKLNPDAKPMAKAICPTRVVLTWPNALRHLSLHLGTRSAPGVQAGTQISAHLYSGEADAVFQWDANGVKAQKVLAEIEQTQATGTESLCLWDEKALGAVNKISVLDLDNRTQKSSRELALSGAQLSLYKNEEWVQTWNVPVGSGNMWSVFQLENGSPVAISTLQSVSDPKDDRFLPLH